MAVRSVRGSGIGQVDTSSILPQAPSFSEQLSRITSGQQPLPIQQGLGIDLTPLTGEPAILPSESAINPALAGAGMGMPDESSGLDIFGQQPTGIPFTQGLIDLFSSGAAARGEDVQVGSVTDAAMLQAAQEEAAAAQANADAAAAQRAAGELTQEIEAERAGRGIELGFTPTPTPTPKPKKPEGPQTSGAVAGTEDDPVKAATVTALDEYLKSARPGVTPDSYDKYIEEFQKATGLDVSGQPDKSTALMAFGLALMQNKAGKGFDVGEMLSAVGGAGEKALPELTKARSEARAVRAKAGEYALGRKKEDQAAAMNRTGYYIVPRGQDQKSFIDNFDKGRLVRLNSYELNALDKDVEFGQQYEILPMSVYDSVAKEVFKTPEYGDKYASSYDKISLFTDAPDDLQISVQRVDANYKGPDRPGKGYFNPQEYDTYKARLDRMASGLNKTSQKLASAYSLVRDGKLDAPGQIGDAIVGFGNAFGLNLTDQATDRDKVIYILESIGAQEAPRILGEAGKTISDADRERVGRIVGRVKLTQDPNALALALKEVHDLIVVDGIKDVNAGMTTLNQYAGISAPSSNQNEMPEGEDEEGAFFDATE